MRLAVGDAPAAPTRGRRSAQTEFKRVLQAEIGVEIAARRFRLELDEEIEIAMLRVEVAARRRAEQVEPAHAETAAQGSQFLATGLISAIIERSCDPL